MIERLQRRKILPLKRKCKDIKHSQHLKYIARKIIKFWNLKNYPTICELPNESRYISYTNLTKCDFKVCNKYVFKIPTNKKEMFIKAINITKDFKDLHHIVDILTNVTYNKKVKYIYLLINEKEQDKPIIPKKTIIINN